MRTRRLLVSLSGGGYRAALFNAGVLRALHEKGHLDLIHDSGPKNVIVNAVSGGSIPAALWNFFLRSSEYQDDSSTFYPEKELIRLVTSSPSFLGRFNWHAKGLFLGAQSAWYRHLLSWWEAIPWKEHIPKLFYSTKGRSIDKRLTVPGSHQYYPTFLLQTLDFNRGQIFLFFNGDYIQPSMEFFKNGNLGLGSQQLPHPHGIVSATAVPLFFPAVKVGRWSLMDAGLIDNQGILGFLPLLSKQSEMLLDENDVWYLSDAGRSMSIAGSIQDEHGAGSKSVKRLSLADRGLRLTGDLSQPLVVSALCNLVSIGLGTTIVGAKMDVTSHKEQLWVKGKTIHSPQQSAQIETSLSRMNHCDAAAVIAHGAQCASLAFGLEQAKQQNLALRLADLAKGG